MFLEGLIMNENEIKRTNSSSNNRIKMLIGSVLVVLIALMFLSCNSKNTVNNYSNTMSQSEDADNETKEFINQSDEESLVQLDENKSDLISKENEKIENSLENEIKEDVVEQGVEKDGTVLPAVEIVEEEEIEETKVEEKIELKDEIIITEVESEELTTPQWNAINMLNYITVLTQDIYNSKNSRIYLDSVQFSLLNNLDFETIDSKTQGQINNLWRTIDAYKMIDVKRERLDYIYEQTKAQALRSAMPNPIGLLSAVESGNFLKTAASVLYMAVDSKASYDSAIMAADLTHLQENWELENKEREELSNSQLNLLNYMTDMARDNGISKDYTLTYGLVADFVEWRNEDNLTRKISWLESKKEEYKHFRTYWIELVKSYYSNGDYRKCLFAMEQYEKVATKIFRADWDYAEALPLVIIAAKETMTEKSYVEYADKYVREIISNCDDQNWALRYFVAQIYIDLYAITGNAQYVNEAYKIAYENVNMLVTEQMKLNASFLADIEKVSDKDREYTERQKEEVEEYNNLLEAKRKVELPPVSEAFYLNCDLLFALADERNIYYNEKEKIDKIIHGDNMDQRIFLTDMLDNKYWASKNISQINSDDIDIIFNGEKIVIPASCITEKFKIKVLISL